VIQETREVDCASVTMSYLTELSHTLSLVSSDALARAIGLLLDARTARRRVYVMGNGGSAATASHFVCDLVKTAHVAGLEPLRAFGLSDNTPLLTAWANDSAYDRTFAEPIRAFVEPGDVVIAISASGNSPNILAGLTAASERGAQTIGLLGFDGGAARALADVVVHVPSHDYGLVEAAHSAIAHAMTTVIRQVLQAQHTP
jgi:D-sedoheptulose 7-phosphate isomerase